MSKTFWRIIILSAIAGLMAALLLTTLPAAHGQSPQPTFASTSWQATPTAPVPSPTPGNGDDGVIMWQVTWLPGVMR